MSTLDRAHETEAQRQRRQLDIYQHCLGELREHMDGMGVTCGRVHFLIDQCEAQIAQDMVDNARAELEYGI